MPPKGGRGEGGGGHLSMVFMDTTREIAKEQNYN